MDDRHTKDGAAIPALDGAKRCFADVPLLRPITYDDKLKAYESYCAAHDRMMQYEEDSVVSIDKWMIALPSVAIVISLGAAATIPVDAALWPRQILALTLVSFALSIITAMLAKGGSYLAARSQITVLERAYSDDALNFSHLFHERYPAKFWEAVIHWLNVSCFVLFLAGVVGLTTFGVARCLPPGVVTHVEPIETVQARSGNCSATAQLRTSSTASA